MIAARLPNIASLTPGLAVTRATSSIVRTHAFRQQQPSSSFSSTRQTSNPEKNVVVVDGVRLPFAMTSTIYEDQMAVDLQRLAYQGLITKTALDKKHVDYILAGNVIQEVRTSNIAREAAINAGFPASIGAHTVAMVRCIHAVVLRFRLYFAFLPIFVSLQLIPKFRLASLQALPSPALRRRSCQERRRLSLPEEWKLSATCLSVSLVQFVRS